MLQVSYKKLAAVALTLGLSQAGGAGAILTVTDSFKDGSFSGSDITYGNGDGEAFVTPLLFTADQATQKTASSQVVGAGIDYSCSFSGGGACAGEAAVHLHEHAQGDRPVPQCNWSALHVGCHRGRDQHFRFPYRQGEPELACGGR